MTYYKWFADKRPIYADGVYVLDGGWQPRIEGDLVLGWRGYHVCRDEDLVCWRGTDLAEVEIDPDGMIVGRDNIVVRSWRLIRWLAWTRKDMADCAWEDAVVAGATTLAFAAADADAACAARHAAAVGRVASLSVRSPSRRPPYASAAEAIANASAAIAAERERQKQWILNRVKENEAKGGA